MLEAQDAKNFRWLRSGDEMFGALLTAIACARHSIRFETYIYADDELGRQFRDAFVAARRRGVIVRILIDAFGSLTLPASFWEALTAAGGEVRWFNPMLLRRFGYRNHRKALVCDETAAYVGGFNIGRAYEGDGIHSGWHDLGMALKGPLVAQLAAAFDGMFARADARHQRLMHLKRLANRRRVVTDDGELLLSGPGRGQNPFRRALREDMARAKSVRIISAYFLPTRRLRRDLMRVARRGGKVQLILPGKSDVLLSQLACRSLYRRLLKSGVEVYEYQPQILHAKLLIVDNAVYVGSSNLDPRSLRINYELMLRLQKPSIVEEAREMFQRDLRYCRQIQLDEWRKSRSWWSRFKQRWAYFILVRIDPLIARWRAPV